MGLVAPLLVHGSLGQLLMLQGLSISNGMVQASQGGAGLELVCRCYIASTAALLGPASVSGCMALVFLIMISCGARVSCHAADHTSGACWSQSTRLAGHGNSAVSGMWIWCGGWLGRLVRLGLVGCLVFLFVVSSICNSGRWAASL
jgi:hypothetical protein